MIGSRLRLAATAMLGAMLAWGAPAAAAVRIYTDEAAFRAALSADSSFADFEEVPPGFYGSDGTDAFPIGEVRSGGMTFRSLSGYLFATGDNAYGTGTNLTLQQRKPTYLEVSRDEGDANAFGLKLGASRGEPIELRYYGRDSSEGTVTIPAGTFPEFEFVGLISDSSLGGVFEVYSEGDGFDLDDVYLGMAEQAVAPAETGFTGGTPDAPNALAGEAVTEVGGFISGEFPPEAYVGFDWDGGDFAALGSLSGADAGAAFLYRLFDRDAPGVALASVKLDAGNGFSAFLRVAGLGAGRYSIGLETADPLDPEWFIRFEQPVSGSAEAPVPEPASWALLIAGLGTIGAAARRRRPLAA